MLRLLPAFSWNTSTYLEGNRAVPAPVFNGNLSQPDKKVWIPLFLTKNRIYKRQQGHFINTGAGLECLKCPRSSCLTGNLQSYSRIDFIGAKQSGLSTDQRICQLNTAAKGQPDVQGWWCLTSLLTAMTITEIASPPPPKASAPPNKSMQFHCSLSDVRISPYIVLFLQHFHFIWTARVT